MNAPRPPATPLLGTGQVRHTRLRPARNAFAYPTFFLLLPMRSLRERPHPELARNRWGAMAFFDRDHGEGGPDALAWFEGVLAAEGVHGADGEVWLHTYPRVLGFVFKPVSFWYAHAADGRLCAVLAEVNNTFGERHAYLLTPPAGEACLHWGRTYSARKVFHVSPFCDVQGGYRFRFLRTDLADGGRADPRAPHERPPHTVARIDLHDATGAPLIQTSVSGTLVPATRAAQHRALRRQPLMTLGVIARIHWQALQLWRKRVPFFRKPGGHPLQVSR